MRHLDQAVWEEIDRAFDVWPNCGCESYETSLREDVEFDVIDLVLEAVLSDRPAALRVARDLGCDEEHVADVLARIVEEVSRPLSAKRTRKTAVRRAA